MMNAPTNNHGQHRRSNFNDSEQSLRRSFLAIHNSPTATAVQNPTSSSANNNGSSAGGNGSRRGAQRPRRFPKRSSSRRVSVETVLTPADIDMLPSLPFSSKAEELRTNHHRSPPHHHRSSRERGDDGRRRSNEQQGATSRHNHRQLRRTTHTGIAAETAQGMIAEIVNTNRDKNNKDRSSHHKEPPRRVTVSFTPSDEQLQQQLRQSQDAQDHQYARQPSSPSPRVSQPVYHQGFRPDYVLGESSRQASHMIVPQDDTHAITLVSTLSKHDFAWVKRSNGRYSYAILAYRTSSTDNDGNNKGEGMAFVMDEAGSTKMIRKKYWCEYVRLVRPMQEDEDNDMDCGMEMSLDPSTHRRTTVMSSAPTIHQDQDYHLPQDHSKEDVILCQEIQQDGNEEDGMAPLPEIAVKTQDINDECSMISSVSDNVRKAWRKSWIESWDDM